MSSTASGVERTGILIDGKWESGNGTFDVMEKFTGKTLATVARASLEQVNKAVDAARRSFEEQPLEPYRRYEILSRASLLVGQRRQELVQTIVGESGFTVSDAAVEVNRCIQTLMISAEEAKRIAGEMVPLEGAPGQAHRLAFTIRVPRGVICAITPFNSPLNTVTHKIAPALAAGNTVVLKPASYTPLTAAILCEILIEAGLPPGHINLVNGPGGETGRWLAANPHIKFYAFTGSTAVGKALHQAVGLRQTALELGSIAATIVCEDANLEWALPRCVAASFRKAGQVCTSVQRLYVHDSVVDRFTEMLREKTVAAKVGDPYNAETLTGPMISGGEAERAEAWVSEAIRGGARLVCGGKREGSILEPTILIGVKPEMRVMCEEIFAPVISIVPYGSFDDAVDSINGTPYGLATGVFTNDLSRALAAAKRLHVGSVHINETSSSRVDLMPYAGAKDSGFGREGPRYSIQEMTEERLVTISRI
jgi:succinate-semialdehyde dehydrogenase/glutarate-semialdehyde dehydrogenase